LFITEEVTLMKDAVKFGAGVGFFLGIWVVNSGILKAPVNTPSGRVTMLFLFLAVGAACGYALHKRFAKEPPTITKDECWWCGSDGACPLEDPEGCRKYDRDPLPSPDDTS